jgi:integrase/recombinase XerD
MDDDLLVRWTRHLERVQGRQPSTVRLYVESFERFAKFVSLGSMPLSRSTNLTVEAYLGSRPITPAVFNRQLSAIRNFFKFLVHENVREDDPTEKIRSRRIHRAEAVPPTFDESIRLVEAAKKGPKMYRMRNEAMLECLLGRGLRGSELLSLKVSQLDLQAHEFLNVRLKGEKWENIEFSDLICEKLEKYLEVRDELVKGEDSGFVFLSNRGQALTLRTLEQMIARYARVAGISKRVTPHLCRHAFASELNLGGADIKTVQTLLAHERLTTTQRYVHTDAKRRKRAVAKLGDRRRRRTEQLKQKGRIEGEDLG